MPGLPGVSASEARALIELVAARGIAQGELAGLLGLEKSTVSRLAAGLERKGWVRRGRDEGNQRYVRLYLTPEGTAVAGRLWRAWQSRQARLLAALSDEERRGLTSGLRGLVRGLAAEGLADDSGLAAETEPAGETYPAGKPGPAAETDTMAETDAMPNADAMANADAAAEADLDPSGRTGPADEPGPTRSTQQG